MTNMNTEQGLIQLIATDRIEIPISSISGKLKRQKPELTRSVSEGFNVRYSGERTYARVATEDKMKARGMKEGIEMFAEQYPAHAQILNAMIEYKRAEKETHLYFGMKDGCRITADDYRGVMNNLGFSSGMAEELYPALMDVSRKLSRQRGEERSILIG